MSDHWQNGPPGPPHDPSFRSGDGGSTGGYTSPGEHATGGYGAPVEGYGPPRPAPPLEPGPYAPGPYGPYAPGPYGPAPYGPNVHGPNVYGPVPHPPGPYGTPPPPYPAPGFPPVNPYYVEPPDRTSAIIALVVSITLLFTCVNPLAIGGLIFSSISLSEARDRGRAARHARYAWYSVVGGFALVVLFFGFLWLMVGLA